MGLISGLFGNASEIDAAKLQQELEPVLAPGEAVRSAFKMVRDLFVFTEYRLILIDKQGLTGSKAVYHSLPYRSITQFSVETAGTFDADAELKIWTSSGLAVQKEFRRGTDIVGLQRQLAACVAGLPKK